MAQEPFAESSRDAITFDFMHDWDGSGQRSSNLMSAMNLSYTQCIPYMRHLYQYRSDGAIYMKINPFQHAQSMPWITVDPSNLYLTGLVDIPHAQGSSTNARRFDFPEHVHRYNDEDINLSYNSFCSACGAIRDYFSKNSVISNAHVKELSFFTSEAARFDIVYELGQSMLLGDDAYGITRASSWRNWSPILHNWGRISGEKHPFMSNSSPPGIPVSLGMHKMSDGCDRDFFAEVASVVGMNICDDTSADDSNGKSSLERGDTIDDMNYLDEMD